MELSSWQHQPIVPNVSSIRRVYIREWAMLTPMGDGLKLIWWAIIRLVRSRVSLEAEILSLRHQLNVLRRKSPKRLAFSNFDRLVFAGPLSVCAAHCGCLGDRGAGNGHR